MGILKVINSWESHYHSLFYYSLLFSVKVGSFVRGYVSRPNLITDKDTSINARPQFSRMM